MFSQNSSDTHQISTLLPNASPKISYRSWMIALGYGALAGAIAGVTFWLMGRLEHLIWNQHDTPWYIFGIVMIGGILIAAIRHKTEGITVKNPTVKDRRNRTLFIAVSAIIAVGFGGAVGPEAGLIAVVSELSAIIGIVLAKNAEEERLISETGTVAALSGLYAAPPGSAMLEEEKNISGISLALKIAAGVAGLGGFLFIAHWLDLGGSGALPLPKLTEKSLGKGMLQAILPSVLGTIIGVMYVKLTPFFHKMLHRMGSPFLQTVIGTAIFGILAAFFPLLRFSGHHELAEALELGVHGDGLELLLLGLLKVTALSICLASGWRGGAIFPLLFAGAAVGAACAAFSPEIPITVAAVAGMSSAAMIGLGKPAACFLLLAFLTSMQAPGALCMGLLFGIIAIRLFNLKTPAH